MRAIHELKIRLPMDFLCDLTWQVVNQVEPSPLRPLVENKHGRLVVVPRAYCTLLQNTLSWNEMARRSKTSLENEIERSRWEEKWDCIPKLVDQLSSRTTSEPSIGELHSSLNYFEIWVRLHLYWQTQKYVTNFPISCVSSLIKTSMGRFKEIFFIQSCIQML